MDAKLTTAMRPPPPRIPTSDSTMETETIREEEESSASFSNEVKAPMGPPSSKFSTILKLDSLQATHDLQEEVSRSDDTDSNIAEPVVQLSDSSETEKVLKQRSQLFQDVPIPYSIPSWSGSPGHHFYLEVLKDGSIIDQLDVNEKGAYMFGRVDVCDFMLEHPTISRFHAVIQFKSNGDAYLYDLGSTHGSFINKNQVQEKVYVDLRVGDVIRFGQSSRLYIFQGPSDLMPPEADMKRIRDSKNREETVDRDASLRRARHQASLADGISWGMGEDAEEVEDEVEEVTWQTYKGQLTEKQEKTREKVLKRTGKIAHMKKEIDAIRAKDIGQGGLTQGQQTQIARNEQRITQIMEELENLEETLNESIQESLGARSGKNFRGKKQGGMEDDEEFWSDDDEFYDRTKKKSSNKIAGDSQSIETADSLLDKRDGIIKEMEDRREKILVEKNKTEPDNAVEPEVGDSLDAYMSGLSSQLVIDKTVQLQSELTSLQSELDRILYLLKIADPAGEASKKRESKLQDPKPNDKTNSVVNKPQPIESTRKKKLKKPAICTTQEVVTENVRAESSDDPEGGKTESVTKESKVSNFSVVKPMWLGAIEGRKDAEEGEKQEAPSNVEETDKFVDYKDRNKISDIVNDVSVKGNSEIESAGPGLILRKRKKSEKTEDNEMDSSQQSTPSSTIAELKAEDAVALLLKHKRGYYGTEEEERLEKVPVIGEKRNQSREAASRKAKKKSKRVLGPEKPSFITTEYESWVPPEGQSGDGRTSLNERYGY